VLDQATQPVSLGIVVPLGRRPDPDHERLHSAIIRTTLKVALKRRGPTH
jgi:hypothetical protein